jgi:hypothetical protein
MTLKVRCQQCGKTSQFSASDAGLTALCVACGARFTIPSPGEIIPDKELKDATADASLSAFVAENFGPPTQTPELATAPVASPASPIVSQPTASTPSLEPPAGYVIAKPAKPRSVNYALLYTLLGSAITAAIVLAAVAVFTVKPTWENRNSAAIHDLRTKAENLAARKKYQEASDTYRQIDDLVTGHEIHDDKLNAELNTARADRDAIFKQLLKKVRDQTAVKTTSKPVTVVKAPATAPKEEKIVQNWPEYHPRVVTTRAVEKPAPPKVAVAVTPPPTPIAPQVVKSPLGAGIVRPAINVQRRQTASADEQLDEAIGQAIHRAVNHLIPQFQNGRLDGGVERRIDAYQTGLDSLVVYALLQSSFAIKDDRLNPKGPFIRDLVSKMKAMPAEHGPVTYARGIRATALALLNRPEDKAALQQDVAYLINSNIDGAYTYQARPRTTYPNGFRGGGWDNSNSQYGLLGVWSGAEVGIEVNNSYWTAVENHWTRCQLPDGSWEYAGFGRGSNPRPSMCFAGCASLFVTHDWLDAPRIGAAVGREPFSKALSKGLNYLETGDNSVNINDGYTLYGLERVGLASGFKFFGDHEWYRELAKAVIHDQEGDGSWGSEIETAYHLLFLARGRHPVLMNKLRYDGYWANRPRDVANLARFGSKELERPLNWQVVPITRDWTDWMDSPILYISSHVAVEFSDEDLVKIRSYVEAGGLLFTQADGSTPEADHWAEALAKKLFPLYEMKDLSDQNEIYTILYKPSPHPKLRGVSNGARLLMVHSPADITQYWQLRQEKSRRSLFELGMNLFLYASGKADLRNRLSSTYIPPQGSAGGGSIKVARLKYPGNWDPEPMAWTRFSRYFQRATDVGVNVTTVDLERLDPENVGFAHWTGTDAYTPTAAQIAAIRKFVEAGGVLLIEPCGGAGEFYESARFALLKAFPEARPQILSKTHPLLSATAPGMEDLTIPQMRPYTKAKGIRTDGRLDFINFGKGKVLFSTLDMTTGLTACNTWGILGYDPTYASSLLKNMLIWSASGMKEE